MGVVCTGVSGTPQLVPKEAQGTQQGAPGGCRVRLDRAALKEDQGENDCAEGGEWDTFSINASLIMCKSPVLLFVTVIA